MFEKEINEIDEFFINENTGKIYRGLLAALEKPLISKFLLYTRGNQLQTAKILGINRNTLRGKIKKLGIGR